MIPLENELKLFIKNQIFSYFKTNHFQMNYKSFDKNKFIKLFEKKQRTSQSQLKLLEDIKQLNYLKRKILKPLL